MPESNGTSQSDQEVAATVNVNGEKTELTATELFIINEVRGLTDRLDFARRAGLQFDGDRDIWEEVGAPTDIKFEDYVDRYERQHIAGRIVDLPAMSTWKKHPTVKAADAEDDEDEDDSFRDQFEALASQVDLWRQIGRADRVAGVGRFGLLFLGFDDVDGLGDLSSEPQPDAVNDLLYVQPFSEGDVNEVTDRVQDPTDPNFRLPQTYEIDMSGQGDFEFTLDDVGIDVSQIEVHADRIIHIAEDALFTRELGRPRLKRIFNLLLGIEKIVAPWAEAFWSEVHPDWLFDVDEDKKFVKDDDIQDFEDEVQKFVHKLQRFFVQQGVEAERVTSEINSFADGMDWIINFISGETGIPRRKLIGSERGDLASTQDERAWASKIEDRRTWFAEPVILEPFVESTQRFGILPDVPVVFEWPSLFTLTQAEKAEILAQKSTAAKNFDAAALSGQTITPMEARGLQDLSPEPPENPDDVDFREEERKLDETFQQ